MSVCVWLSVSLWLPSVNPHMSITQHHFSLSLHLYVPQVSQTWVRCEQLKKKKKKQNLCQWKHWNPILPELLPFPDRVLDWTIMLKSHYELTFIVIEQISPLSLWGLELLFSSYFCYLADDGRASSSRRQASSPGLSLPAPSSLHCHHPSILWCFIDLSYAYHSAEVGKNCIIINIPTFCLRPFCALNCFPPKSIRWSPYPHCDCIWK